MIRTTKMAKKEEGNRIVIVLMLEYSKHRDRNTEGMFGRKERDGWRKMGVKRE